MDGAGRQHYLAGHDRLEAPVHQLDADSPLVLDEDANDSLAGEKGHAARGEVAESDARSSNFHALAGAVR